MSRRNIGGSVLPSNSPEILRPISTPFGTLQVKPILELDTHALMLTRSEYGTCCLVQHPNGYSCHNLAMRMVSGDVERVRQQVEYISDCGGLVSRMEFIIDVLAERGGG